MKILKRSGKRAPDSHGVVIRQIHHSPRPQKRWHLLQCLVSVVLATCHLWTVLLPGTSERRWPKRWSRRFDQDIAQPEVQVGWDLSVVRVKIFHCPANIVYMCLFYNPLTPMGIQGSRHSPWHSSTHRGGNQATSVIGLNEVTWFLRRS